MMADLQDICAEIDRNIKIGNATTIDTPEQCKGILSMNSKSQLRILTQNIRSVNKNFDGLQLLLNRLAIDLDIIVLTECWLSKVSKIPNLPSFRVYLTKRNYNQNDGIIIYVKDDINARVVEPENTEEINCLVVTMADCAIIGVYRPHEFTKTQKFTKSIDKIITTFKQPNIVLIGDMNIDIKHGNDTSKSSDYTEFLAMQGLLPTHTFLTTSKSCMDHCFIKTTLPVTTIVCYSTVTDHASVLTALDRSIKKEIQKPTTLTKTDYNAVIQDLGKINWEEIITGNDPEEATNLLLKIIKETTSKHSNSCFLSRRKTNLKPWITPGLIRCLQHRDRLHLKLKKDPNNLILQISYIRYRRTCNKILKNLKNSYFRNELHKNENNAKNQWRTIKKICYMDKSGNNASEILNLKSSPQVSVNYANKYFVQVGKGLAKGILDRSQLSEAELIKMVDSRHKNSNSFVLLPTDEDEIKRVINSLRSNWSSGWDCISSIFLKRTSNVLAKPISLICNLSFERGIFPKALKKSIVIPIHKAGDRDNVSNYRPISLLPTLAKVLEKLINKRLMNFLEKYNILQPNQYGFRNGKSTSDAIEQVTSFIVNSLDKSKKCLGIFLDLAKAFDTVSVPILLKKLDSIGIRGQPLRLLADYMTDRKQSLKVNDTVSNEELVHYGVPQGSVLGPTLFLIYINDLCRLTLLNGQIVTFADDTVLLFHGKSWRNVNELADEGFRLVTKWLDNNLLTLNATKTKFISFSIRSNTQPPPNSICIKAHYCSRKDVQCDCTKLQEVSHIRYLGVIIDKNLNWQEHVLVLTGRVKRLVYIFRTLRYVCDSKLLFSVYYALCQSILTYGISAWGGTAKSTLITLERAQRTVLKVMMFKKFLYPTSTLYSETPVLSVRQLFIKQIVLMQHKTPSSNYHKRRKDIVYEIPYYRTSFGQSFIAFLGPYLYNKISSCITIRDLNVFNCKNLLNGYLKSQTYEESEKILKPIK